MNFKKGLKIASLSMAIIIGAASLSSCGSLGKKAAETASPAPVSTAATDENLTPEEAIIGSWEIEAIIDKDDNSSTISDIDLKGTVLENYESVVQTILKKGVTFDFKDDKTVSFLLFSAEYQISEDKLTLSIPQISQSMSLDYEIDGKDLSVDFEEFTLKLSK